MCQIHEETQEKYIHAKYQTPILALENTISKILATIAMAFTQMQVRMDPTVFANSPWDRNWPTPRSLGQLINYNGTPPMCAVQDRHRQWLSAPHW